MPYQYRIKHNPRGYEVTNGKRTFHHTAASPHMLDARFPDDGTDAWLTAMAKMAAEMYERAEAEDTPAKRRERAYQEEADSIFRVAQAYEMEAREWRKRGSEDKAKRAEENAAKMEAAYLDKKEEIRQRIPDEEPEYFYLTDTNVYHANGCDGCNEPGEWLTWEHICTEHSDATPCKRCLDQ